MSELRKATGDAPYFLSLSVVGWIDIFTRREYADELIANLAYCQQHKGLDVYAYVIMPSHVHMIARRKEGNLNELLRDFKSYTAKRILQLIENNPQESRRDRTGAPVAFILVSLLCPESKAKRTAPVLAEDQPPH